MICAIHDNSYSWKSVAYHSGRPDRGQWMLNICYSESDEVLNVRLGLQFIIAVKYKFTIIKQPCKII